MKTRDILATFNRGLIGRMAVARVDVERVRLQLLQREVHLNRNHLRFQHQCLYQL